MKNKVTLNSFIGNERLKILPDNLDLTLPKLPDGWRYLQLKDLLIRKPQYGLTAKSISERKGVRYIRISDITDFGKLKFTDQKFVDIDKETFDNYRLEEDDVLIARSGSVGRIYLHEGTHEPSVFASYLIRFKLDKQKIVPKFLFYYCLSPFYKNFIQETLRVVAQPNINAKELCRLKVPVPSLDVQRRVVARLEEITAKIEHAKKLREEALKETEKIMQTTLHQIFSNPEQKGWKLSTLEEVAPIQSNSIQSLDPDRLYNYISLEHIESNTGRLINFAPTPGAEIKSSKIAFTREHVLYGKLRPYLNKVFVPDFDGICTTELVPLLPRKETITREFLAWQLRSPQFVNYAMSNLTGTRMPRISLEALKNAKVAIPPIDEQIRIAALLDKLQNQIAEIRQCQKETVEKLEKMTQTILKKAFMGEL